MRNILNNAIFKYHDNAFPKLLAFRVQMVLAYQIIAVVVGWHIYELTRDPLALGLVGLAEVIPYFASALFAGHAVDHFYSRRMFGVISACILIITSLILVSASLNKLNGALLGGGTTTWIYFAIILTGFARAFISPSYNTLFALILPRKHFARAAGIGTSAFQAGLVIGPALGGLLVGFASKTIAYSIAALLFFGAAVALLSLKIKEPPPVTNAPTVFASIGQGLKFVVNNQILFGAQMLDMFAVLFGGAVAMLPVFIHEIYNYGAEGLGILRATPALGGILAGIYLTKHPINFHAGRWLLAAVAGFGMSIITFALIKSFWIAALVLMISGALDAVSVVLRSTIMQLATPDEMRGRVSSINGIFIGSSNELGAFESGLAARLMGLIPSVIFGGLITLSVVGITAKFAPKLRQLTLNDLH